MCIRDSYTYLRPNELAELRAGDVDLTAGTIHITRAREWVTGVVKAPKTRCGIRRVPIEAVSYTHLDVYKRQAWWTSWRCAKKPRES